MNRPRAKPLLIKDDEVTNIARAAVFARKSEITIRRWCKDFGISRQVTPHSPHEVSMLALSMVMHGDFQALDLLRDDDRGSEEVRRHLAYLGLGSDGAADG